MKKLRILILFVFTLIIWNGCSDKYNPVVTSPNETLILFKDSISNFSSTAYVDTIYRDTTIRNLKVIYDLITSDTVADSSVNSGYFIGGNPLFIYQTYGKYNSGHYENIYNSDSVYNYLHVGFEVYFKNSLYIKMYHIRMYKMD